VPLHFRICRLSTFFKVPKTGEFCSFFRIRTLLRSATVLYTPGKREKTRRDPSNPLSAGSSQPLRRVAFLVEPLFIGEGLWSNDGAMHQRVRAIIGRKLQIPTHASIRENVILGDDALLAFQRIRTRFASIKAGAPISITSAIQASAQTPSRPAAEDFQLQLIPGIFCRVDGKLFDTGFAQIRRFASGRHRQRCNGRARPWHVVGAARSLSGYPLSGCFPSTRIVKNQVLAANSERKITYQPHRSHLVAGVDLVNN